MEDLRREEITIDQVGCARCHGDGHPSITFFPLTHPIVEDGGLKLTHWALCPTLGEPILMTEPIVVTVESKRA